MNALQQEAGAILRSLFQSSGRSRGTRGLASGLTMIDDDEEMMVTPETHITFEQEAWPSLPSVARPPAAASAPPPPIRLVEELIEGQTDPEPCAPSHPPPPEEDQGSSVDWGLSSQAEAVLLGGLMPGGVRVILERQAGGTASDKAFAAEIESLETAVGTCKRLVACAFKVTRCMMVNCVDARNCLQASSARISRMSWESKGWREQMPDR